MEFLADQVSIFVLFYFCASFIPVMTWRSFDKMELESIPEVAAG